MNRKRNDTFLLLPPEKYWSNLGTPSELSSFSDRNICWVKIGLAENKGMKTEVTTLELEEEI